MDQDRKNWRRITLSVLRYDSTGKPGYVVGITEDITKEKEMEIALKKARTQDPLTGLYRCAESTLQYLKKNGKGRAVCYPDTSNELGSWLTSLYPDELLINSVVSSNLSAVYSADGTSTEKLIFHQNMMPSVLHAAFWNEGTYAGAFCWEKNEEGYEWTDEEKRLIKELARIAARWS